MKKKFYLLFALSILTFSTSVKAAHFTFTVTGSYPNFAFSPNSYNVTVGDTIIWQQDFDLHPLGSTDIPIGAPAFADTTHAVGTYMYVVPLAGTYNFMCTFHGFTGSFVASPATGVKQNNKYPTTVSVYPTVSNNFITINVTNEPVSSSKLSLAVYNVLGNEVINLDFIPGNTTQVQVVDLANGIYFATIREDNLVLSVQKFVKN